MADELHRRLDLAHQARRAKEHQLDGIRRALCDVGVMRDDDPYSHADLADVIRQWHVGNTELASTTFDVLVDAEPEPPAAPCELWSLEHDEHDAHEWDAPIDGHVKCPGWTLDDGTRPELPPEQTEDEKLRDCPLNAETCTTCCALIPTYGMVIHHRAEHADSDTLTGAIGSLKEQTAGAESYRQRALTAEATIRDAANYLARSLLEQVAPQAAEELATILTGDTQPADRPEDCRG